MSFNHLGFIFSWSLYFVLSVFISQDLMAQSYISTNTLLSKGKQKTKVSNNSTQFIPKITSLYAGYAIELKNSNFPLTKKEVFYNKFGKIRYLKSRKGNYIYFITTKFKTKEDAQKYNSQIVQPQFPEAKVIKIEYGQLAKEKKKEMHPKSLTYNMPD